jgi:hypothetical protein
MVSRQKFSEGTTSTEVAQVFAREITGRLMRQHSNVILERGSNVMSIAPILITGVSPKSLDESIALSVASFFRSTF